MRTATLRETTQYDSVTFESQSETIVGRLYRAAFGDGPAPAVKDDEVRFLILTEPSLSQLGFGFGVLSRWCPI